MKVFFRIFEKIRQIPICLNGSQVCLLIAVSCCTFVANLYSLWEHEVSITKTKVKMQIDTADQTIKNRFDLAHMHIALDYVVTQTIYDSIHSLQIPYTIGILLKAKNEEVIYKLGEFDENTEGSFLAKSEANEDIYLKVPIFSGIKEYEFTIILENIYRAKVNLLPGQAKPIIEVNPPLGGILLFEALVKTTLYIAFLIILWLMYMVCAGFGKILHDQGQYKFLYRVLAAKICELSAGLTSGKELTKIARIITFVSSLEREAATSYDLITDIELVEYLDTLHEAYKYNFENIEFITDIQNIDIKINRDALAAIVTNSFQNAMIYVTKLPPSLDPKITLRLINSLETVLIKISNTFQNKRSDTNSIGLGTVSISEICNANRWKVHRIITEGEFSLIIEIPRKVSS